MSLKDYVAECGCVIEMNVTHDWESGVTDAEEISIITPCEKHRPTQRAADGVNRAPENLTPPDKVPPAPPRVKSPRR